MKREKQRNNMWMMAGIGGAAVLLLLLGKLLWPSQEYGTVQTIIKNLPVYQEELERWGYRAHVFHPQKDTVEETEGELLRKAMLRYGDSGCRPVLILTDSEGGLWCFCHGFDQYAQETTHLEQEERLVEVTTRLWLQKDEMNRVLSDFNYAKRGKRAYYDMKAVIAASKVWKDTGEPLERWDSDLWEIQYCSNNFEEYKDFTGSGYFETSDEADRLIKNQYTPEQLLEIYWQGIALQERLMELARTK